jgi:serine-type D-Ala-D-Ala carboxypeptidase (penicillin-binding protein 5/6)
MSNKHKTAASFIVLLLMVMLGSVFFLKNFETNTDQQTGAVIVPTFASVKPDLFEDLVLETHAAYVFDVQKQKMLFGKNEEAQLPLASLTKLMTALAAYELLPESSIITISHEALGEEGDSGLLVNERWLGHDLINFMLMISSNDAAGAIAITAGSFKSTAPNDILKNKEAFVGFMNAKAREIGLTQTYFTNETGLDTHTFASGSYGSARDMALLLEYILNNAGVVLESTQYPINTFVSLNDIAHDAINTNKSVDKIPGLIASKTGYTDLAGGNLLIVFDAGIQYPIIVSVLGSTQEGRFIDVEKLVEASLQSLDL